MDMLLRDVSIAKLAEMFRRHEGRSPVPHLTGPGSRARAVRLAKKNGTWADLAKTPPAGRDILVLKRSAFRDYQRTGNRDRYQERFFGRFHEMKRAALAAWLRHPKADIDYLQDLMWAWCDELNWVLPAHERGGTTDLFSMELGAELAEICHVLGTELEEEVRERALAEVSRRVFEFYRKPGHVDYWKTSRNNWNHVCNGSMIRAALFMMKDPEVLANFVHGPIQNMTYALDGFTEDGGCAEGPSYWGYGFGHYLYAADALCERTGGELNIMTDPKIGRICRYPLATVIEGNLRTTFADSSHGFMSARIAILAYKFVRVPELFDCCSLGPDRTLRVGDMHELGLYRGQRGSGNTDQRDYLLPDLGQVKLVGRPGPRQMIFAALAGNNGVPHNHNDIGSFLVYRGGKFLLVDPGAPIYTSKTFSKQRYEIVFCNATGHSVPVINGRAQESGAQYRGSIRAENLNGAGRRTVVIDLTQAYPAGTVKTFDRVFEFDPVANRLTMEDRFEFGAKPASLEEAFVTFERAKIGGGGRRVRIGPRGSGLVLECANAAGRFKARRLVEESKEGRTGEVLTRIVFVPTRRAKRMSLRFLMR